MLSVVRITSAGHRRRLSLPARSTQSNPSVLASLFYPPKSKSALLDFVKLIESKSVKQLHQACLLYYLFLDYPESLTPNDNLAQYYADEIDMPEGFRRLVDGFHYLDRLELKEGLLHLSHPAVTPTYPEAVVNTFVKSTIRHQHSARTTNNYSLAIAYITAKSPALLSPHSIDVYVSALCAASIYAALNFARAVSDIASDGATGSSPKTDMLRVLVNACLAASVEGSEAGSAIQISPFSATKPAKPRKNPIHNLLQSSPSAWRLANLPLTPSESAAVETILNDVIRDSTSTSTREGGDASLERRKAALAKDVLLLRALHTGDMEAASRVGAMGNFKLASTVTASGPPRKLGGRSNGHSNGAVSSALTGATARGTENGEQVEKPVEWSDITRGLNLGLNA